MNGGSDLHIIHCVFTIFKLTSSKINHFNGNLNDLNYFSNSFFLCETQLKMSNLVHLQWRNYDEKHAAIPLD